MNEKTIKIISAIVAAAGGVLAVADTITAIPNLPPYLVNAWPVFLAVATLIHRVGSIFITPEKKP